MSKSYWLNDEDQKGNFSNKKQDTFDPGKRYIGIRLQQGVPLLDRDWNELEDMRRHAEVMLRRCYIGNGTPDDGFRISLIDAVTLDFRISSGRCLVDGFNVVNEPYDESGNKLDFILYSQQEGVAPLTSGTTSRLDTVYLDVWIEEVSKEQDSSLGNSQDIDMETCRRHKLEWRVQVDEGSQGYEKQPFHHYYDIAKLSWVSAGGESYFNVEDLRVTGLALYSINASVKAKGVTNGDNHAHTVGDGAQIKHSSLNKDDGTNPHGTTAANVGALPITGGNINGNLAITGNVGIGTVSTTYKLEVQGNALFTGNYIYVNSENAGRLRVGAAWGMPGLYSSDDGERDLTLGVPVGRKVYLGMGTGDAWVEGGSGNAYFRGTTVANVLQLGTKWRFSAVGDAHGNDGWLRMFNVANTGYYGGFAADQFWSQSGAYHSSDLQLKKDIKSLDSSLTKLSFLRGVRFKWKNLDKDDSYKIGLIAQEVEPVFPELVENGPDGMKSLNYTGLIPPLIEAIKEQQKKIEGLIGAAKGNDYAEYFESKSSKAVKPGTSIVLDDAKIRPAKENEIPMGIISANPGILGGMYMEWPKKYLRDEFGNQIMEEYKEEIMAPKKEKVKRERQKMEKKKVKEKVTRTEIVKVKGKYCQKEFTETIEREIEEPVFKEVNLYDAKGKDVIGKHRILVMETVEEEIDVLDENGQPVMKGTGKFETKTRPKINPEYDETKEYIPREKRPEWNCVGLLGQLPLRKGQPVAPTWIKIKDISKDVELWLVK
jgi:hypothetical protein